MMAYQLFRALDPLPVLGFEYPPKMLPFVFFETTWKLIRLVQIVLLLRAAHQTDDVAASTLVAVLIVMVFPFIVPWRNVARLVQRQWRSGLQAKAVRPGRCSLRCSAGPRAATTAGIVRTRMPDPRRGATAHMPAYRGTITSEQFSVLMSLSR